MKIITYPDRAAWLAARHGPFIGASECYAMMHTPFALYAEKAMPPIDREPNEAMFWGTRLEPVVREEYEQRIGKKIEYPGRWAIAWSTVHPWLFCSLDGLIGDDGVYEGKTSSIFAAADWEEGVPDRYFWQAQHAMAATVREYCEFACLVGGQRLAAMRVDRNEEAVSALIEAGYDLSKRIVERNPPPVDGSVATTKALKRMHPDDNGETCELDESAALWANAIEEAKDDIKNLEKVKAEHENRLRAAIGDNTFARLPNGWIVSYKTQERKAYAVERSKCRVMKISKGIK